MSKICVITIQGATGVGKSKLAFELAQKLDTEIISADSRQVYKLMDKGTAKPTVAELLKVKHHLIDIIYPNEVYNAGRFVADSDKIIAAINNAGKIPLIVGGTGFYIKSLLDGLFKSPQIPNEIRENLRNEAKSKPVEYFYEYLKKIDKESAARINQNDLHRILRAIEVYQATGKTLTQFWKEQKKEEKYRHFDILLFQDREKLYNRINERVLNMIDNGLIEEIKKILQMGFTPNDPGLNAVGYKEFIPYIKNEISLDTAIAAAQQNTRNYAKRQFTWYRKIHFDLTLDINSIKFSDILNLIISKIKNLETE